MADEDALFAEFMGEIKSAVVAETAAEPAAAAVPAAGAGEALGGDGDASDTASVGDVNAHNDKETGENDAETNKRKGEVCVVCAGVGVRACAQQAAKRESLQATSRRLQRIEVVCAVWQAESAGIYPNASTFDVACTLLTRRCF